MANPPVGCGVIPPDEDLEEKLRMQRKCEHMSTCLDNLLGYGIPALDDDSRERIKEVVLQIFEDAHYLGATPSQSCD